MFEFFLNPANMIVGGALISSPIIIHLINRMRFRRIRWAAMEFLLKSQKRNRRRLIIEQLILLLLRILLVLLAGLLLARLIGWVFAGTHPKNFVHVVILDDRLSMNDFWKDENGAIKNCFQLGKERIEKEIAKVALQSRSPQRLVLLRLSDLQGGDNPDAADKQPEEANSPDVHRRYFDKRLTDESFRELSDALAGMTECTKLHLSLAKGVDVADQEVFGSNTSDERQLHIVTDLRQDHWSQTEAADLTKKLMDLRARKITVNLIDTAHPYRTQSQQAPGYHDNLAIVDLRPETKIAAEGMPVLFTVRLANFSQSDRTGVRVTVKVDGVERPEGSVTIMKVPAGKTNVEKTFQVGFVRPQDLPRGAAYFAHVTANLENEEAGLQADNIRYAVVEVRKHVPVLLIDGDLPASDKSGGDTYHLKKLFTAARGYEVLARGVRELEQPGLDKYPSIYLLNVRELSDKGLKNLDSYVRNGGSAAFFVGEKVDPNFYNKKLYANGKGMFPAPLADKPTPELSEDEKYQKFNPAKLKEPAMELFVRSEKNEIFGEVYDDSKTREVFRFLTVDRHYPVPRTRWLSEAQRRHNEAGPIEEVATLPNERPVADYEGTVRGILKDLPTNNDKYGPMLEKHAKPIEAALRGQSIPALAAALQGLLKGKESDPQTPKLLEFWEQADPEISQLHDRIARFRESVELGDPLVISRKYHRGRTVAWLTTAGSKWNDWAGGGLATATYPIIMIDLQKYLTGIDRREELIVGSDHPLRLDLDSVRYKGTMHRYMQIEAKEQGAAKPAAAAGAAGERADLKDLGEQTAKETKGGKLPFVYEAREPGIYEFELTQKSADDEAGKKDRRAEAFNVDTLKESDLKRANQAELERVGNVRGEGGTAIIEPDRQTDLSESAWLYLLFLAILVAEQALAVHLSFHLKASEAQLPAQAVRPPAAA